MLCFILGSNVDLPIFFMGDRHEMGENQNQEVPDSEESQEDQNAQENVIPEPVTYNTAWGLKFFAGALFGLLLLAAMYFGFKWLV